MASPRHIELEAADAAKITGVERSWLQVHLDADAQLDELEKALLDFLAPE
jgi:LmbE family N-acetylglucosaminyl deacetylase